MSISSSEPFGPEPSDPDATAGQDPASPLYVIGDVHGQAGPLRAAMAEAGLIDGDGHWAAGRTRLWFLGDLTDRGPDGVGVIELVRRLGFQAAEAGGLVDCLLGNHEILLLGSRWFGDELIELPSGGRSFRSTWQVNGGRDSDLDRLTDEQAEWLRTRPAMTVVDDHLLVHSDTLAYLDYGDTVAEINDALRTELAEGDAVRWWDCFRQLTRRHDFRGEDGGQRVAELLGRLGGSRLVHGHSPIPEHLAVDPEEVTAPLVYADRRAVSVDGGLFAGGPCLITRLPLADAP